jgi:hypothetical protein
VAGNAEISELGRDRNFGFSAIDSVGCRGFTIQKISIQFTIQSVPQIPNVLIYSTLKLVDCIFSMFLFTKTKGLQLNFANDRTIFKNSTSLHKTLQITITAENIPPKKLTIFAW